MSAGMIPFDDSSIITDAPDAPAPVKARVHVATGFGIAASNAAESRFLRDRMLSASWDRMSVRGKKRHIENCPDSCSKCVGSRAWGECSSCGDTTEALGDEGLSRCCGSLTILGGVS